MNRPITIPTTGKLDKDSDPQFVQSMQGNYIHLQDMDMADTNTRTRTTTKGTLQVLDFGEAVLQNQKIRINITPSPININLVTTLKDGNGYLKFEAITDVAGDIDSIKDTIALFLNSLPYPVEISLFTGLPFMEVRIAFAFADYRFTCTSTTIDILEEAVSTTGVGRFMPIGSYDQNGDVFYWLTTQRELITPLPAIQNTFEAVNNQVGVTIFNHGLNNFETVALNAVGGTTTANGVWTVIVLNNDQFILNNSSFINPFTGGGEAFKNYYGYGCIGVMVENYPDDTFSFIPLLKSKELNLVTKKEIYSPQVEINGDLINAYFTDFYNNPRVFYYRGEYIPNGALRVFNPDGIYSYGTIRNQLRLQQSFTVDSLTLEPQQQSGGNLAPGNWRYAVRFLDENFVPTEASLLTQPIPVYLVSYDINSQMYGNENTPGFVTPKINRVRVEGILPGAFKFIELIGVNYSGGQNNAVATVATIIRQEVLGADQTSIILEHNGNEIDTRLFDARQLVIVQINIERAADLAIVENRLVLENIVTEKTIDFQPWIDTFKYSIRKEPIQAVIAPDVFYEFYDPAATSNKTGYQFYEWYRFYAMIELKTGKLSDAFFLADVRMLTLTDYDPNEFISTNLVDKRFLPNDDFNTYSMGGLDPLGDDNQLEFNQYYVQFNNINWDYLIDGISVRDLVKSIRICRAERIKEVEASGVIVLGSLSVDNIGVKDFPQAFKTTNDNFPVYLGDDSAVPYINGQSGILTTRRYASFYSPDIFLGQTDLVENGGYELLNFGAFSINRTFVSKTVGFTFSSSFRIYTPSNTTTSPQIVNIIENKFIGKGLSGILGTQTFVKFGTIGNPNPFGLTGQLDGSPVFLFDEDVNNTNLNFDSGVYHAAVFRRLLGKYGSRTANNNVLYCGAQVNVEQTEVDVFGGDVFTQQTYYKPNYVRTDVGSIGKAAGTNIISQNVVNTNLRTYSSLANGVLYPIGTQAYLQWLEFDPNRRDQLTKNSAYNVLNQIQYQPVYNPTNQDSGFQPTRKYYSQYKPTGSRQDFYRIFYPFDFADNPQKAGQIIAAVNFNNRLFTIQERGFTIEYFNDRGKLIAGDAGEILIGDGSVLPRVGNKLSSFGTQHRGSVVIGKSQSGKDLLYYISADYQEVMRFGDDGLRAIALTNNMRLFFKNNLRWAREATTPADGYGITGVWDNRQKRVLFTVKAWKPSPVWADRTLYPQQSTVIFGTIYQGVPQLWFAMVNNPVSQPSDNNPEWLKLDITNPDYYNCYTVAFSEMYQGGGFEVFHSYLPNHYTQREDGFFSGFPDLDSVLRSELHRHNVGQPATYYGIQFSSGVLKTVVNWNSNLNKKFFRIMLDSSIRPERVNIQCLFRNFEFEGDIINDSFLVKEDFFTREGFQISTIKAITDENGSNDDLGGQVEGIWCTFEIIFEKNRMVTLNDLIVTIRDSFANYTR